MAATMDDATPDLVSLHRTIRRLLAERLKHGATEKLDPKLMALIEEERRIERAEWFN